jgi:hypothetical protein
MAGLELFFFYFLGAASCLSLAAINAGQGGLTLFFLWRLVRGRWRPTTPEWLLIAYLAANVLSALFSPLRHDALVGVLNHWSWSALFVGASLPWTVRKHYRRYLTFLAAGALLTVPMAAAEFFLGTDFHHELLYQRVPLGWVNAYAYFSTHLTYAGVITVCLCLFGAMALYGDGEGRRKAGGKEAEAAAGEAGGTAASERPKGSSMAGSVLSSIRTSWFWWLAAGASAAGLFFSLARTYYVAALPALAVLFWKKGKRAVLAVVAAVLLAGVVVLLTGPPGVRERLADAWNLRNPSVAERIYLWISGLQMWRDRPLLGWGPGIYAKTAGPYKAPYARFIHYPTHIGFQTVSHAHNIYLMVAIQSGLLGLVLFLAFVVAAFKRISAQPNPGLKYGAMAALTAILVGGFFEFNVGDAEVATLIFFVVGLAVNREGERDGLPGSSG